MLLPPTVELVIKDLLPCDEVYLPLRYSHHHFASALSSIIADAHACPDIHHVH